MNLLDTLAKAEAAGLENRSEFANKFKTYKWTEKLETIAYAIEKGLYPHSISYYMLYNDTDLQDKRLVPFIARAIRESEDENLLAAVNIACRIPDPSLLTFLMEYALGNDYKYISGTIQDGNIEYLSVFGSTARAIYEITDGKIGSLNYSSTREEITEDEKQSMIKQWRQIYDETLKQDYEPDTLILPETPAAK